MVETVDYDVLDRAKNRFIEASRSTLEFAREFGGVPHGALGGSANVFSLALSEFHGAENLNVSLVPEGLGTADDARPDDLSAAEEQEFWRNIAFKTLSSLTNDAASSGLQSILVGLYLPSATPETVFHDRFLDGFLSGFVEGCKKIGCVYISGETPQLKTKMIPGKIDIAGSVCAVSRPGLAPVDGRNLQAGDTIVMFESSGPHENGFTTLRAFAEKLPEGYRTKLPSGEEVWRAMNKGSVLYTPVIQAALKAGIELSGLEHITGHGWQKIMRSSKPLCYRIENVLPIPEIFTFFQEKTAISHHELCSIFNCGAGFAAFLPHASDADRLVQLSQSLGVNALIAGKVENASERKVIVAPWKVELGSGGFLLAKG